MQRKARGKARRENRQKKKNGRGESGALRDSGGNELMVAPNAGSSNCALLTLLTQWMRSVGIPSDTAVVAVNGKLSPEMVERVKWLRKAIVDASHGHPLCENLDDDGTKETRSFEEVVQDPNHIIETREMWELVTLCLHGYLDGRGLMIGAEILGMHEFKIVSADGDGNVRPVDGWFDSTVGVPMAIHHAYGHYEAVFPRVRFDKKTLGLLYLEGVCHVSF